MRLSSRRKGFSLVEMAIVVAVIGTVIGVVWIAGESTYQKQRVNDAVTELQTISQNLLNIMTGRSFTSFTVNYTQNAITSGIIPSQYVNSPTAANTPWSTGGLTIWALAAKTARIAFYGSMPTYGCVGLVLGATQCDPKTYGCPRQIIVQTGVTVFTPDPSEGWNMLDVSALTTACVANAASGTISVEFDYAL